MRRFLDEQARGVPLKAMNKGRGVDMSHVVSDFELRALRSGLMSAYFQPRTTVVRKKRIRDVMAKLDTGYISSDADDDDVRQVEDRIDLMLDESRPLKQRCLAADDQHKRVARSTRMLFGGDARTNRAIGESLDRPQLTDGSTPSYVAERLHLVEAGWKVLGQSSTPFPPKSDLYGKPLSSTGDT